MRWGVESEGDVFSAFMENIRRGDCDLDVHRAVSLETFLKGKYLCHLCHRWAEKAPV